MAPNGQPSGGRDHALSRIRQAVLAASDLDAVAGRLRAELGLHEPFADPGVAYFGLRNAVFALGDTFLEVVSPIQDGTAAGRLLEQRGDCGYMVMFQVAELVAARARAAEQGVREVFEVDLDDMTEVHLHPKDMRGAIVSLSSPQPPTSWRWGGEDWERRSVPLEVLGVQIEVSEPTEVEDRWQAVLGAPTASAGVQFTGDTAERGIVEITLAAADRAQGLVEIGGVRFRLVADREPGA